MADWFISEEAFKTQASLKREADKVLNWFELEEDIIYTITSIGVRESEEYGTCYILDLADRQDNTTRVWAPSRLIKELKEKRKPKERAFIVSLGKEQFKKKSLNKYDLIFKETKEIITLFDDEVENQVS